MNRQVYCEKCLEIIEEKEDLVILNGKPYHYNCYEKELKEEKKKTLMKRFVTWRFINSGLIANIQAVLVIALGVILYLFGGNFADEENCHIWGTIIIAIALIVRMYGFLSFEIKAKRVGRKSRILQSKDSVLQIVKIEAVDLLKVAGLVAFIAVVWNLISSVLM